MLFRRQFLGAVSAAVLAPGFVLAEAAEMPEAVVQALVSAMAENYAGGIRAVFADNASQAYGAGSAKSGEAFRAWLTSDIITPHGRVENAELTVDGNAVVVTGQYRNTSGYTGAADFLFIVEEGKIVSWQMRY